ncbi:MAG: phage tail spike protein [Peptostreptococcaceae bacterium]|nr:phage tail spike protein [Peptostreptococcaceae bacterium]
MQLIVGDDTLEIYVMQAKVRKTLKGERTLSIDFLAPLDTAKKIKKGAEITMGKDVFVVTEAVKRHGGANKVSFSLYAEHISYKLLEYDMNGFIEDKKKDKKAFDRSQKTALEDFKKAQEKALEEFLKTHTDAQEIDAFKKQQAEALSAFEKKQEQENKEYEYKEKSAREVLQEILKNTEFTLGRCKDNTSSIRFNAKTNKREILMQIVNNWQGELDFDGKTIHFDEKIGHPNSGYRFATGHNLKGITVTEHQDGIKYAVDFAEIGRIDPLAGFVDIGDTVTVQDETVGIHVTTRVIEIEYNPFQRKQTYVVLGNGLDYTNDFLEALRDQDQYLEEKINDLPEWMDPNDIFSGLWDKLQDELDKDRKKEAEKIIEKVEEKQTEIIQEVFKEKVIDVETAHILNAWIRNMLVENLETNFADMNPESTEPTRNYISAKEMTLDFITETLGDELEDYKVEEDQIYYTAIGSHPEAKKYLTITDPGTFYKKDETLTDEENEQKKKEFIEKFKVKRRKVLSKASKLKIAFEKVPGTDNIFPMITFGQGDGTEHGQKCFWYKDTQGFVMKYYKTNDTFVEISLSSKGAVVINEDATGSGQLRNIHIGTAEPQAGDLEEGDLWVVV